MVSWYNFYSKSNNEAKNQFFRPLVMLTLSPKNFTLVFFFFAFGGFISPEDASDAVPSDDANPPWAGKIKLVADVELLVELLGVPGGVCPDVPVAEDVAGRGVALNAFIKSVWGLRDGGMTENTISGRSWSCLTSRDKSTIWKKETYFYNCKTLFAVSCTMWTFKNSNWTDSGNAAI